MFALKPCKEVGMERNRGGGGAGLAALAFLLGGLLGLSPAQKKSSSC